MNVSRFGFELIFYGSYVGGIDKIELSINLGLAVDLNTESFFDLIIYLYLYLLFD